MHSPKVIAAVLIITSSFLDSAAAQSPGTLDAAFGLDAGLTASSLRGQANATDVTAMPDGGWVVSGLVVVNDGKVETQFPLLARYRADGMPDTTFGVAGKVVSSLQQYASNGKSALLRDGQRLYHVIEDWTRIRVLAYTFDGRPDLSYGDGGMATIETGTFIGPLIDAVLQDGRVLIGFSNYEHFLLARVTASGDLDVTFGGGVRDYQIHEGPGVRNLFTGVTLQEDGKIVAVGRTRATGSDYDMVVARFDADGNPDPGFGDNGFRVISFLDNDLGRNVVAQGGKIVIAGTVCSWQNQDQGEQFCKLGAARLLANGNLDPSYGAGGRAILQIPALGEEPAEVSYVLGLALDQQGRAILSGYICEAGTGPGFLVRLANDGALDTSFGSAGVIRDPYRQDAGSAVMTVALTTLHDGAPRLITVGWRTQQPGEGAMVIARHLYDGNSL